MLAELILACVLSTDDSEMMVPHGIPDFGSFPTVSSVQDGDANVPETWGGRIPGPNDVVRVSHKVRHCGGLLTVRVLAVDGEFDQCNSELRVKELIAYPGSTVELNPGAKIIIRDMPTDDATDPLQWGTGVITLGKLRVNGTDKKGFVRLAKSVKVGDATLTLLQEPTGWKVGDRVCVPDTRLHSNEKPLTDTSETFTIQAIAGTTITLNKPATWKHMAVINADGVEEFFPHVGNLSRDVSVESEDPNGTRGHFVVTMRSDAIIRNAEFRNLGRTTTDPLDSSVIDLHTGELLHKGTNQVGRYNGPHMHHCYGPPVGNGLPYQFEITGCAVDPGDDLHKRKWGIVVHQSHFGLVSDNVVWNCPGAAIATEDGNEFGNLISKNFIARVDGSTRVTDVNLDGSVGDGVWLRGPWNRVNDNVIAAIKRIGIAINIPHPRAAQSTLGLRQKAPTAPGQDPTQYTMQELVWRDESITNFDGNEMYRVGFRGFFVWQLNQRGKLQPIIFRKTTVWNSAGSTIRAYAIPTPIIVEDFTQINDPAKLFDIVEKDGKIKQSTGTFSALVFAGGRTEEFRIIRARVENTAWGIWSRARNKGGLIYVKDSVFRNSCNAELQPTNVSGTTAIFENVKFGDPFGRIGFDIHMNGAGGKLSTAPYTVSITNHNETGEDYDLYFDPHQRPDFKIPPPNPHDKHLPEKYWGMTNAQAWELDRVAMFGGIARRLDTNPRVIKGFFCKREDGGTVIRQ